METLHSPTFSYDWFTPQAKLVFERWLLPLAGKCLRVLEVGSFEGRSALWLLDNVLTHSQSMIDCVDTFEGGSDHTEIDVTDLRKRFLENVEPYLTNVRCIKGDSWEELCCLYTNEYDIVFIDGSHEMWDVLHDAIEAYRLAKPGGLIIFDDYGWGLDRESRPGVAIDAFLHCFATKIELLEKEYCVVVRKL